jgi:hypothetical protein
MWSGSPAKRLVGRPSVFGLQLVRELEGGGVKSCEEPHDDVPAHAASSALEAVSVRMVFQHHNEIRHFSEHIRKNSATRDICDGQLGG